MADLGIRFRQNPLLTPGDLQPSHKDFRIECVLNPGVFEFEGKTWLVLRVAERPIQQKDKITFPVLNGSEEYDIIEFDENDPKLDISDPRLIHYDGVTYLSTISHLRLVCSEDGIHFSEPDNIPTRLLGSGDLEAFGIEDCRVVKMNGHFLLTYTQVSRHGVGVGLMRTADWSHLIRDGMMLPPHNKDCALFPEQIGGKYYCLHRPSGIDLGGNFIWLANSNDLEYWGHHKCILTTRNGLWDSKRVGAGASPIRTDEGWLVIYHGADAKHRYCLGACLLDPGEPHKVLARATDPIMEPIAEYEQKGFFGNVVFTNGHIVDGDTITVYYGASDSVVCGATFSVQEVLSFIKQHS